MNLTTATPAEIDTLAAELYRNEGRQIKRVEAAVLSIRGALGQKSRTWGRGASKVTEWPNTDAEAIAAIRAKGTEYIGMGRTADAVVKRYDEAAAELAATREAQAPLDAEYDRRPWSRFYIVAGGHIHKSRYCSTCNRGQYRTEFGWMPDMSGMDEAEALVALAERSFILCTVCFPNAPTVPVVDAAPTHCLGSGKRPIEGTIRGGQSRYGDCPVCTDRPLIVGGGVTRKHKAKDLREVAETVAAPAAAETDAPVEWDGRTYGQLTEDEKRRARTAAAGQLQAELTRNAPALAELLGAETGTGTDGETAPPAAGAVTVQQGDQPAQQGRAYLAPSGLGLIRLACGSSSREAVDVVRRALVAVGQITRELDDRQLAELGRRLGTCRPVRAGVQLHPFLAARLAFADDGSPVRKCCRMDSTDLDCAQVHPGFADPSAAFAAIAAEIEAEAVDPAGYLDAQLAAQDAAAGGEAFCRFCRCTENRACPGGCAWASDTAIRAAGLEPMDGDVCTACLPGGEEAQLAAYAADDARRDDADLDDAAAGDDQVAGVLAIAAAAPAVTITDPAGLLELVKEYATQWHRFLATTPDTASIDAADQAEAEAAGTLAQIAAVLGLAGTTAASVPAPRIGGDGPPAG